MTVAEPVVRVGGRWIGGFALCWLGVWLAQLTVIQLLLPQQIERLDGRAAPGDGALLPAALDFGRVSAVAGLVALVAFPLVGALSDRTASRFGRRRPWIAAGTLVFAAGLLLLGAQRSTAGVALGWSIALGGFAVVSSALTALIADQVPVDQRGLVSAFVSVPQAVGTVLGLLLVEALALPTADGYVLASAALVVCVLPFLLRGTDPPLRIPPPPLGVRGILESVWIDPRSHPDFAWTLAGRLLVNLGNALGTSLLLYFLADGLHDPRAEDDLLPLVLVYLVLLVVASVVAGRLSDRTGRRRAFVAAAAVLQGAAALLLVLLPSLPVAMVAAGFLGAGYGVFLSVDQALATQVLPDAASRGKDLGIMNIALAVPQAFGPLLGAGVIAVFGGFGALFAAAALLSALGALAVGRIRGVA